ncbi:SCO0607 family lipoprotein [Streptomyces sp. NPDC086023]|uniref:SCO0607 family lipoprotein n=1 Tax=Streptomyces sp. NPDC086023 TaxID=3365746 RepID=UPI0037D77771
MLQNRGARGSADATGAVRASRQSLTHLAVAGLVTALFATGCGTGADRVCGGGHYPVKAVGNTTGQDCVPDGQEPPAGYVRYPEGKVPEHVGDKWDDYWSKVVVDEKGNIVSGGTDGTGGQG